MTVEKSQIIKIHLFKNVLYTYFVHSHNHKKHIKNIHTGGKDFCSCYFQEFVKAKQTIKFGQIIECSIIKLTQVETLSQVLFSEFCESFKSTF